MVKTTLSSKYQLFIPKQIREEAGLKSGEKMIILAKGGIINLIPKYKLKNLRGFLKGMKTKSHRETKDRE